MRIVEVESLVVLTLVVMSGVKSDYIEERNRLLKEDESKSMGAKVPLTSKEIEVNKIILEIKQSELGNAYKNSSNFLPSQHFFKSKNNIELSKMFSIIRKLPKGASLHTHMLAGVSVEFIIRNITYKNNLYGCYINDIFKLKFFDSSKIDPNHKWKSLQQYRNENQYFDEWLRKQLTLEVDDPDKEYPRPEDVWRRFKKIFTTMYDMICYRPVFELYITQLLQELMDDNVIYTELRGTFMPVYELNGTVYDNKEFFKIFIDTVNKFKYKNPQFIGVRYIHSIYRGVTPEDLQTGLRDLVELLKEYPDFIAGFDFVGYEEEGHQLVDYHEVLLSVRNKVKFFFHAGETNWYGHTDLNLIDAILLNASRVGHGFSLPKHPVVMDMYMKQKIPVEVCPISNQVMMLNDDPRNHPAVTLIANGFPLVICNDDPSVWGATGLSYDWYIVFMAMTSKDSGVGVLKELAMNSILYSTMTNDEQSKVMKQWDLDWNKFIDELSY